MIGTLRRQLCSLVAPLAPIDRYGLRAVRRVGSTPLDSAVAAFCHLGRGGLVWFALAPLVGSGRRPLGRLEGTAISVLAIGSALAGSAAGQGRLPNAARAPTGSLIRHERGAARHLQTGQP